MLKFTESCLRIRSTAIPRSAAVTRSVTWAYRRWCGRCQWRAILLLGLALVGTSAFGRDAAIPAVDGLYVIDDGVAVRLEPTLLRLPVLRGRAIASDGSGLAASYSEQKSDPRSKLDSDSKSGPHSTSDDRSDYQSKSNFSNGAGFLGPRPSAGYLPRVRLDAFGGLDIFVRAPASQFLTVRCISLVSPDYLGQETDAPLLETSGNTGTYRTRCHFRPETMLVHLTLNNRRRPQSQYTLAIVNPQHIYDELLTDSNLSLQSRLNVARMALADLPTHGVANDYLANLIPFQHAVRNKSLQRLLGQSPGQYREQEIYSYKLAMRNGSNEAGYSLKDYLKDYPLGRFVDQARLEISRRRRDLYLAEPRWFEQRAESILRQIMKWADSDEKTSALNKYLLAYPDGRFTLSVKLEIDRLKLFDRTKTVAGNYPIATTPTLDIAQSPIGIQ